MRATEFPLSTLKETPSDAEVVSHQLMLRAGLIKKLASGLYTWLPLGVRVLNKVESIVREEMDKSGALEVLMPVAQPAEIWNESGRWDQFGPELLRFQDRHNRDFCLGPTHEEVITNLASNILSSYRQLPVNFYQIQTKFRDEVRPRFGVMRAREFTMKDSYSFHMDQNCLDKTYGLMRETYCKIFDRIGLDYRPVAADTGSIGGTGSHEFHVLASSGEDDIAFSDSSDFAANIELAEALAPSESRSEATQDLSKVPTPDKRSIDEVSEYLDVAPTDTIKTLVVYDEENSLVAICVRGDHSLNEVKATKIQGLDTPISSPLRFASEKDIAQQLGASVGSIGPIGLNIPIVADRTVAKMGNFVCGANEDDFHFTGVNWSRDLAEPIVADVRNVVEGDPSPCGQGHIVIKRGIEVGHIFQLGTKYSETMNATVLNEDGKDTTMTMGCYGLGVTRVVAAAIEQNNDENGIIWPEALAPFQVAIVPINLHKSEQVRETCEKLYTELKEAGYDPLLMDEPKARLGGMLADVELIGIPHRIVVGDRGLDNGTLEYRYRRNDQNQDIPRDEIIEFIKESQH